MTQAMTLEYAPFTIADGVSEEQLLKASAQVESDFLASCEGYISRTLIRKDEKNYADIVYWANEAAAKAAMEQIMQSESCKAYFDCMDLSKEPNVAHCPIVGQYS